MARSRRTSAGLVVSVLFGAFRPPKAQFCSQSRERTVAGVPSAGFNGGKGAKGTSRISTLGVLRLRATKPSVCDRSAKRSAQEDGFVAGV
jgi:hypothetical protein